jgi:hypothetical protein
MIHLIVNSLMLTDILSIIHGYPGMMCGFRTSSSEEP